MSKVETVANRTAAGIALARRQADVCARRPHHSEAARGTHSPGSSAPGRRSSRMPTTPITAPVIAPLEAGDEVFYKTNVRTLRNASLRNVLDMCGVALPNGCDGNGMPQAFSYPRPGERMGVCSRLRRSCASHSNGWFERRGPCPEVSAFAERDSVAAGTGDSHDPHC